MTGHELLKKLNALSSEELSWDVFADAGQYQGSVRLIEYITTSKRKTHDEPTWENFRSDCIYLW